MANKRGVGISRKAYIYPLFVVSFFILFVSINLLAFVRVVSDGEKVKVWLDNSGVYENAADLGVELFLNNLRSKAETSGVGIEEIFPLAQFIGVEDFSERADRVFPASWIQAQVEKNLDSYYLYLYGGSPKFKVSLNFDEREVAAATEIKDVFIEHFESLPDCEDGVVISPSDYDLFGQDCVPQSVGREVVMSYIEAETANLRPIQGLMAGTLEDQLTDTLVSLGKVYWVIRQVAVSIFFLAILSCASLYFLIEKGKARHRFMFILYMGVAGMNALLFSGLLVRVIMMPAGARVVLFGALGIFAGELMLLTLILLLLTGVHFRFMKSEKQDYVVYLNRFYKVVLGLGLLGFLLNWRVFSLLKFGVD